MAFDTELPTQEEVSDSESNFLSRPGTYHFSVTHADENPQYRSGQKKGQMIDGFEIEAAVLAGPEKGKQHRFLVRHPNLAHKDGGMFCKTLRGKWLEAIAVTDPSQRGKTVTIELVDANGNVVVNGRQFKATLVSEKSENGKSYLELSGMKVWHVDDPNAEQCEMNHDALKPDFYPPKFRRSPESFKSNGNGAAGGKGHKPSPASSQSESPLVSVEDL